MRRAKSTFVDCAGGMIVSVPFEDEVTGIDSSWLAKVLSSDAAEVTLIELAQTETSGHIGVISVRFGAYLLAICAILITTKLRIYTIYDYHILR